MKWLIVFEGVNDLGGSSSGATTAQQLITALRLVRRHGARAGHQGLRRDDHASAEHSYYNADRESGAHTVNNWIRTSNKFDAVIDFDTAVRDPADMTKLLSTYDSSDGLHPSVAGYQKLGDSRRSGAVREPVDAGEPRTRRSSGIRRARVRGERFVGEGRREVREVVGANDDPGPRRRRQGRGLRGAPAARRDTREHQRQHRLSASAGDAAGNPAAPRAQCRGKSGPRVRPAARPAGARRTFLRTDHVSVRSLRHEVLFIRPWCGFPRVRANTGGRRAPLLSVRGSPSPTSVEKGRCWRATSIRRGQHSCAW